MGGQGKDKGQTLTEAIKEDHEEMYEYYEKYKSAKNYDEGNRWARQLLWEVARHAVAEELVVYPLMEKHLGSEGLALANEDRTQHDVVKSLLSQMDTLLTSSPSSLSSPNPTDEKERSKELDNLMKKTMDHLKPHNDSEEEKDLPKLEVYLGEEGSREEAVRFSRTKGFVPTRAHPSLSNKPPYEYASFLVAPIDKLRDMWAGFPTEEMKERADVE